MTVNLIELKNSVFATYPLMPDVLVDEMVVCLESQFKCSVELFGFSDELFDFLYSYYSSQGEMPYGIMKARDGCPYDWVADKVIATFAPDNYVKAH